MMLPETIQSVLETADAAIEKTLQDSNLPGLGVGIVYQGQLIYTKGVGLADVARNVPITPDTVFRIASVSKTFAAVGLMQLWEQGKFDLHDPINDYLHDYKVLHRNNNAPPITFHHLLTHTAGLGEFIKLYKYLSPRAHFNVVLPNKPVPPLRALYGRTLSAECLPGEKWCYANNGFATVGQLVADISGQSFPNYIRQHIYAPLGMDRSEFWRSDRVRDGLAIGYKYHDSELPSPWQLARFFVNGRNWQSENGFIRVPDLEQVTTAAGAMYSTVNDMGRYMIGLMKGGTILKPETLDLMFSPQHQLDGRLQGMGYGFKIDYIDEHRVVSHDGLWLGFVSSMFIAPDAELGVIALTNTDSSEAVRLGHRLIRDLLGTSRPLKKRPEPVNLLETPELWPSLVGYYGPKRGFNSNFRLWMSYGGELEVYQKEGKIWIRSLKGSWKKGRALKRAEADDPLSFAIGSWEVIFKKNEMGEPNRLLMGLNEFYKRTYRQSIRFRLKVLSFSILFTLLVLLVSLLATFLMGLSKTSFKRP